MKFKKGDRVIVIDDTDQEGYDEIIIKGKTYVVREVGGSCVLLKENMRTWYYERFKKVPTEARECVL